MNKYEEVEICLLKPYENNAKIHTDEQVKKIASSIKQFGFINPVLIDSENGIIAGHGRVLGAKELGMEKVPCLRIEYLTEAQKRAYIIADNKLAEDAEWDETILKVELEALQDMDFDISLTGFDLGDLRIDIDEDEQPAVEDEWDEVIPEEPTVKNGQIYQLGNHRLMCGDSTQIEDVLNLMGGDKADMLLTDPPYNVNYEGKTKDKLKIENDKMNNDNFRQFLADAFQSADNVMKNGAVFYVWHADSEGYNFRGACFDVNWKVRQCIIWNKNSMVMGRQDYQWKHEPCLYGWKEGAGHLWASDRKQTTVLNFDRPSRNDIHPTMKPVALFDYQIKNNTKGGDIVLDLFGGSGTTIMACEQNGRHGYLMELDPRYAEAIINRWEAFTGQKAELVSD